MLPYELMSDDVFAGLGGPELVYVRPIKAAEVMDGVDTDTAQKFQLTPDQTLYAVHRVDGERLAVMTDRESAIEGALVHGLWPVSVH